MPALPATTATGSGPSLTWSCPDCGAPAGDRCDDTCPSGIAVLVDELAAADEQEAPCCPTPQAAAYSLCGCWGYGVGAWVGSAA